MCDTGQSAAVAVIAIIMNFEGLAEYAPAMHSALDPVLDAHLNPSLLQNVELDPEGVALEALPAQESVRIMEGVYSELHSVVADVGAPVSGSHFDLHEELLWVGSHGVRTVPLRKG